MCFVNYYTTKNNLEFVEFYIVLIQLENDVVYARDVELVHIEQLLTNITNTDILREADMSGNRK